MPNSYTDTPIASHTLAVDQVNIEANFLYLANTLGTSNGKKGDHQISLTSNDGNSFEGRHLQVCFNNRHGAAPTVAGIGDGTDSLLYSDNGNVFFGSVTGAGAFQLTTYNAGANFGANAAYGAPPAGFTQEGGWSFLPGGLILQYGFYGKAGATGSSGTVQFPIAFPTGNFIVNLSLYRNSGDQDATIDSGTPPSTTAFKFRTSSSGSDGVYWFAIGN